MTSLFAGRREWERWSEKLNDETVGYRVLIEVCCSRAGRNWSFWNRASLLAEFNRWQGTFRWGQGTTEARRRTGNEKGEKRETFVASSGVPRLPENHASPELIRYACTQVNTTVHKLMPLVSPVVVYSKNYPSRAGRSIFDASQSRTAHLFENECSMIPLAARWSRIHCISLFPFFLLFGIWCIKSKYRDDLNNFIDRKTCDVCSYFYIL